MFTVLMRFSILCLLLISSLSTDASDNLRLDIDVSQTPFSYIDNNIRQLNFEQIRRLPLNEWTPATEFNPYGLIHRQYWLHTSIDIPQTWPLEPLYLEIENPLADRLEVYLVMGDSVQRYIAGDSVATSSRPIATPTLYFPLPKRSNHPLAIYINYKDQAASVLPLSITNSKESFESVHSHGVFTGMICGIILLMLVATLMLHRKERESIYLHYCGFLLFGGLTILSLEGITSVYLWGELPWLQNLTIPSLFVLSTWCAIELTRRLTRDYLTQHPLIANTFKWLSRIVLLIAPILFALPTFIAVIVSIVVINLVLFIIIGALVRLIRQSKVNQPLLLASWFAFVISLMLKASYFAGTIAMPSAITALATAVYSVQFVLWGALILQRLIHNQEQAYTQIKTQLTHCREDYQSVQDDLEHHQQEQQTMEALFDERTFELNVTLRELQESNRQLEEQATNDALTGVKNRKFFDQRLQAEYRLSRRQQTPLSLLLLDADKFKAVNDTHGHLVGDQVLIDISKIASRILKRPNDYVCRYGGEEFAILLSNTDQNGAAKVAEVIRQKIAVATIKTEGVHLNITVSIGVSSLLIDGQTSNSLLFEQADQALYHAKANGRNNVKTYQEYQNSVNHT